MIIRLKGKIEALAPTSVELNINDITYLIFISVNTSATLGNLSNKECTLEISQIIKEDSHSLYGFLKKDEKHIFERLLKVNGVGPKLALQILSSYQVSNLLSIFHTKDVEALKRVKGVGLKLASKIILDLANALPNESINTESKLAQDALLSLGFKDSDILGVLSKIDIESKSSNEIVKQALQLMAK